MNEPFPSRSGTEPAVPGVAADLPAAADIGLGAPGFVVRDAGGPGTGMPGAGAPGTSGPAGAGPPASFRHWTVPRRLDALGRPRLGRHGGPRCILTNVVRGRRPDHGRHDIPGEPTTSTGAAASIAAIAAAANPAVVTIDTRITARGDPRGAGTGVGSGFIYDANGSILTAAHVVEGATEITVTLADGRTFQGTVTASDLALDVAVVRIAASGLPTIPLETSGAPNVGEAVIAIGDPLGDYPGSVTIGIVSGLDRSVTVADELTGRPRDLAGMIQTDAAINPGNSGGPLIDTAGKVIGVISASSSSAQGMGFAVPISAASGVMASSKTA